MFNTVYYFFLKDDLFDLSLNIDMYTNQIFS